MYKSHGVRAKGFTLIELMVVIAIIGILASIISVALGSARAKGRDAKRISDIRTLQLALEEYYNDNGTYPATLSALTTNGYLSTVPTDPKNAAVSYVYYTEGNAANCIKTLGYHLGALLEDPTSQALSQDVDGTPTGLSGATTVCNFPAGYNAGFDGKSGPNGTGTGCNPGASIPFGTVEQCYDITN